MMTLGEMNTQNWPFLLENWLYSNHELMLARSLTAFRGGWRGLVRLLLRPTSMVAGWQEMPFRWTGIFLV